MMETSSLGDIPIEKLTHEKNDASKPKGPFTTVTDKVNRGLLVPKLSFFFYFMAIGSFLPYLGVFYKQLWITARESGILLGIRPFIKTLVSPLWGMLADAFNRPKVILLVSIFGCLVGYFSQSVVSPFELPCYKGSYEDILLNATDNWRNNSKRSLLTFPEKENDVSSNPQKSFMSFVSHPESNFVGSGTFTKQKTDEEKTPEEVSSLSNSAVGDKKRGKDVLGAYQLRHQIVNSGEDNGERKITGEVLTKVKRTIPEYEQLQSETEGGSFPKLDKSVFSEKGKAMKALFEADSTAKNKASSKKRFLTKILKSKSPRPKPQDDFRVKNNKEIFIVLLVIVILGEFIASPAPLLADMGTLALLRGQEHEYGHQRLFGSFGWGLGSLITGAAVTVLNHCPYPDSINYLPSFYVFAVAMFCNLVVSIFFKFEVNPQPITSSNEPSFIQGLKLFCSVKNGAFIFVLFFFGLSHSLQLSFLFWFLQDIGGTPILFTTIVLVNSLGEVVMFFCATYFVTKVGNDGVLYFGLFCYGVRFLFYSYVKNPWLVLPLEFLQGITYGGVWTASVSYVGQQPGLFYSILILILSFYVLRTQLVFISEQSFLIPRVS